MLASVLSGQNGSTHVNVISNESGSVSIINVSAVHPLASVMITSLSPALRSVREAPVPPSDHRYDEVPAALTGVMFTWPCGSTDAIDVVFATVAQSDIKNHTNLARVKQG